jgi:uncharacterized membrane protein YheB (UPF0754 family)
VHSRVQEQLPEIVREVTEEICDNIDQLLDVKLMVIRQMEERPELANRVFRDVGERELRLIINLGFVFGVLLGIPVVGITLLLPHWWVLPVCGVVVGWVTNLLAIYMIFESVEPRRLGPVLLHGLFLRRQREVADVYAGIIADDIVTIGNIGGQLMHGPRSDRTRWMLESSLRPAVDRAAGGTVTREAVRLAVGPRSYETIRESVATEAAGYTMTPLTDPEFNRRQSERVEELLSGRMREMSYPDFVELLRSAIREDEWLRVPLSRSGPGLPRQPEPAGADLVLSRDPPGHQPLPGARGPARRDRGHAPLRPHLTHRAPEHPSHSVRHGLLQGVPAARDAG